MAEFISRLCKTGASPQSLICVIPISLVREHSIKAGDYIKLRYISIAEGTDVKKLGVVPRDQKHVIYKILDTINISEKHYADIHNIFKKIVQNTPYRNRAFTPVEGPLAAAIYTYYMGTDHPKTQREVGMLLEVTEVTIRKWNKLAV